MAVMHHRIHIEAPPEKVYAAITTQRGLRGWWTRDSTAEPRVGSIAKFGFYKRSTLFRMRIEQITPGRRVVWTCLGNVGEWKGTRLTWRLAPDEGGTDLRFTHGGWRSTGGWFATCNSTWGALIFRLRDYAEGKAPGPLFKS